MHEASNSFKQHPSQKLHKTFINFEKPQNFQTTQNLDLNAWNAWRMKGREVKPSD